MHLSLRNFTELSANKTSKPSNAQCLTEGIDVPTVDRIAFLTPKRSWIPVVCSALDYH